MTTTTENITGIERLRTLYSYMVGVSVKAIDMASWRNSAKEQNTKRITAESPFRADFGTTACAVGWACAIPEFNKQGLKWNGAPVFGTARDWCAVIDFFRLTLNQALDIFSSKEQGLKAKKLVLGRIRRHLLKKHAITKERSSQLSIQERALKI